MFDRYSAHLYSPFWILFFSKKYFVKHILYFKKKHTALQFFQKKENYLVVGSSWTGFFHVNFPTTFKLQKILRYQPSLRVASMTFGAFFHNWTASIKMASTYRWGKDRELRKLFVGKTLGLTSEEEFWKIAVKMDWRTIIFTLELKCCIPYFSTVLFLHLVNDV